MKDNQNKIGILTLFEDNYNLGGILQACALCKVINNLGRNCEVLSYSDSYNPVYPSILKRLSQYGLSELLHKFFERINTKLCSKKFKNIINKRKNKILDFSNRYIPHTSRIDDATLMNNYLNYSVLISGSDQVWNPNCARKGFLQMFPSGQTIKVSYAASISRSSLSDYEKSIMIPAIQDFNCISVREKSAKDILVESGCKDVQVTLDPTLLLDSNEWSQYASDRLIKEKYILCYFFSDSRRYREILDSICKEKGLKLVYIPYAKQEYNRVDDKGLGHPIYDVGPKEFLSLFKYATYVFTDSFHGTAFSLIFQKEFWVLERSKDSKVSMNSRLRDLLSLLNISNRIIDDLKIVEDATKLDYETINQIIKNNQEHSLKYLSNAISHR